MHYKTTNRLFKGKYQYKLVITCAGASWFRGGDLDQVLSNLNKPNLGPNTTFNRYGVKTQEDLDYARKLYAQLKKLKDYDIRVESPWITLYTSNKKDIDSVINVDKSKVKYVCLPPDQTSLEENTIIMPKVGFDYRVTIGKTTSENSAFISWAESNPKLKLTKSCKRELQRNMSWGGTFFYVSGENNLLMTKMHLGSTINKIERIIKG